MAIARSCFAHAAGAGMDAPFTATFAEDLAGRGLRVVRF
jgi:predicted alpha/beta-hydrolase family hydrolase